MEKNYKTEGYVLNKRPWRENDLLFSFYTQRFGRVDLVAIGARRIKSKLVGQLSVPGLVEIQFVQGRNFKRLTQAFLLSREKIDFQKDVNYVLCLNEIIDKAVVGEERDDRLWEMLKWGRENLLNQQNGEQQRFILNIFVYKLLGLLGYNDEQDQVFKRYLEIDNLGTAKISRRHNNLIFDLLGKKLEAQIERKINCFDVL